MMESFVRRLICVNLLIVSPELAATQATTTHLLAGAAKVDITNTESLRVNDPLYAKALVIKSKSTTIVMVTVDAVAIEEIGSITSAYLKKVRAELQRDLKIDPRNIFVNASHCHGIVCKDVAERTINAVKMAHAKLEPVTVGAGRSREDRIMENRRLILKNGTEVDVRHAYSMPPDEAVASVGPVDPEIGILRLDRLDGSTLAVVYNFACHPIQGVPNGGNTADMTGFASKVIEENASDGTIALFLQGCGGDINPVTYKDVNNPRDAEPLGNMLGLSVLKGYRRIATKHDARLKLINETIALPRADLAERITNREAERERLLNSLQGTSINLKTFVPLVVKYNVHPDFPSYYSHRYLHEKMIGRDDLKRLDAENRRNMERYIGNINTMEQLTRVQTNLRLLRKHQARNVAAGKRTIDVEVIGLRIGDMTMITFPGELVVQIGLNIKEASSHDHTYVAGYTNGYIYYCPTAEQMKNVGGAQEDSDCLLGPEWQDIFEKKAADLLGRL